MLEKIDSFSRYVLEVDMAGNSGGAADRNQTGGFFQGLLLQRMVFFLRREMSIGVFWFNLKSFPLFSKIFGPEAADKLVERLEEILNQHALDLFGPRNQTLIDRVEPSSVAVIVQDERLTSETLADFAFSFRVEARRKLNEELVQATGQNINLEVGCCLLPGASGQASSRTSRLYEAMEQARQMSEGILNFQNLSLMNDFRRLLEDRRLYSLYQPIVRIRSGETLGWEALARGPQDGPFCSPGAMFDFAEEAGWLFQLERRCREAAVSGLGELKPNQKLFVNVHPHTMGDAQFRPGETKRLLKRYGLKPSNVVFEITERHSIKDFKMFHKTLDHYRSQGFQVAIDDMGAGFSGLKRIGLLRPDYIKADRDLIKDVDSNPIQRALIETLVTFADKIGCGLIAEGIETEKELSCLASLGVHYGQGYHLARPARPKVEPVINVSPGLIRESRHSKNLKCSMPLGRLTEPALQIPKTTRIREVKSAFDQKTLSGAVIVQNGAPLGLIMRHNLDRQLSDLYGHALYSDRNVESVMDPSPLVFEASTPLEEAARLAMSRPQMKLYDHLIVTEGGETRGTVSVQVMLDAMARVQLEMAKGANPLTGLPGALALEQAIEAERRADEEFSLIYVDLDNFKVFNDKYGFRSGDQMIRLTADILQWACRRHGGEEPFLGHIGGDDFVIVASPGRAERLCLGVIRCFRRLVRQLYTPEDAAMGYIEGENREGLQSRFPLVSISMGIVDCPAGGCDLNWISQRAASIKKYAKSRPGNVFVRDRRGTRDENGGDLPDPD